MLDFGYTENMRIAILGSVALPVPPPFQGGTEWIAYYQAEGLASLGHKVFLFAAEGSKKGKYELITVGGGDTVTGSNRENKKGEADTGYTETSRKMRKENVYLSEVNEALIEHKYDYDMILNNMRGEAIFLPTAKELGKPFINVMHLPMFTELAEMFKQFNTHVISISNAQRKEFPDLNYLSTVYNCVDTQKFAFNPAPSGEYLLMVGSISRHKNQKGAVNIAKKLGMPLVLAGKIGEPDYFEELKKDIDGEMIEWVGELGMSDKIRLYQNAKAFVFPIVWEEPFGLVMIEAMACGTPVVAFNNGAISEVVVNGLSGYVIDNNSEEKMAEALKNIGKIKREDCRKTVEEKFTVSKMVKDYEKALFKI